jgi:hypothetical protein
VKRTVYRQFFVAVMLLLVRGLLAQAPTPADRWNKSDASTVLADPEFYKLGVDERRSILERIDRKFGKIPYEKQDAYLWKAETANLPKAAPPKEVFTWKAGNPGNTATESTKIMESAGIRVEASLGREEFYCSHIRILNKTKAPLKVHPQTFVLNVAQPKPQVLSFEYPSRVAYQLKKVAAKRSFDEMARQKGTAPNGVTGGKVPQIQVGTSADTLTGVRTAADRAAEILQTYLIEGVVDPADKLEGEVYFQRCRGAREFLLRVFVGEYAFDIPFEAPKR